MIIDRFRNMINRETRAEGLQVHVFSWYFFTLLLNVYYENHDIRGQYQYENVMTWGSDCNIFDLSLLLIPIKIGNTHWTLILVNMADKIIAFYDSWGGSGLHHREQMLHYLRDEWCLKYSNEMDIESWQSYDAACPRQPNYNDCGIYCCLFAYLLSKKANIACINNF